MYMRLNLQMPAQLHPDACITHTLFLLSCTPPPPPLLKSVHPPPPVFVVLIIALICHELVWTEGGRELREVTLGRRRVEDVLNHNNFFKKFVLSVLLNLIRWDVHLPRASLLFLHFVHSLADHLQFNERTGSSEPRRDNSTVKQHCMGQTMPNCSTLTGKMEEGRTEKKRGEKGGQICEERK